VHIWLNGEQLLLNWHFFSEINEPGRIMMSFTDNGGREFLINGKNYIIFPLENIPGASKERLQEIPYAIRVLLEGAFRKQAEGSATAADVENLLNWSPVDSKRSTIPIFPGRVILQDFTGVPVVNDLAAMRSALVRFGGEADRINPVIPVDLVIDHSIQVDYAGTNDAYAENTKIEFSRNEERYQFLHWAQKAFKNFRVVPPASGIVHQVNLEYLASCVLTQYKGGAALLYPDTLVGTDSHTTMINGLGVAGWGVGGIEAVAAMLGEPIEIVAPDVIGVRLTGKLAEGVTPTDLTLTIVQKLRKIGVVDKFVEFFGSGLDHVALADRAMIANMTPETGATMLYFPVDELTLDYLRLSGRPEDLIQTVAAYYKSQGLFRTSDLPEPAYTQTLEIDLASIEPSLAGPKRPQDRVALSEVKNAFNASLTLPKNQNGFGVAPTEIAKSVHLAADNGKDMTLKQGSVVIAAITSCTNTSNPYVMISAGLLAKKAVEAGLSTPPYVKTSLAPGSKVVTDYLLDAGLMEPLNQLGFNLVGYGCTTCIGNSGPLPESIAAAIKDNNLVVGAVLSGNRNFEGRVSPLTRANFLASPPLVVAFALAGTLDIDLTSDPLGYNPQGKPVYLKEIWPSSAEVQKAIHEHLKPQMFTGNYTEIYDANAEWNAIESGNPVLYEWGESTYIQEPPFFKTANSPEQAVQDIQNARVLAWLGDSITTDHISPAGNIALNSPAGQFLLENGVKPSDFNSYGSRRGNDQVMARGTFANIRLKNLLVPGVEGGYTKFIPDGEQMTIFDAAMRYKKSRTPLIVMAGKEYGTGSSRDWAAKGVLLLGVKAVIAESYERIHRSNLAGMGVLPLQFLPDATPGQLGLTGKELFTITGIQENLKPGGMVTITAEKDDGSQISFNARIRLDTDHEITYFLNGGIMNTILLKFAHLGEIL
jgi:aconitate hydratase